MPKFRKKPIVIEAIQWTGENFADIGAMSENVFGPHGQERAWLAIKTLEGTMKADLGDWIIRGVNGEVYPCKPDIFDKTYDLAADRSVVGCWDCGKPYPFGLDVTLPIDQWQEVSGDAQMLCVSCILIRAAELPGVTAARLVFDAPEVSNTGIASEITEWQPGRWIKRIKTHEPVEESEQ